MGLHVCAWAPRGRARSRRRGVNLMIHSEPEVRASTSSFFSNSFCVFETDGLQIGCLLHTTLARHVTVAETKVTRSFPHDCVFRFFPHGSRRSSLSPQKTPTSHFISGGLWQPTNLQRGGVVSGHFFCSGILVRNLHTHVIVE